MASTSKSNYGLTPGEVMDTPIDYTTSIGWKQWEGAIRKLSNELMGAWEDGPIFLKIMISRITIDSRSTMMYI